MGKFNALLRLQLKAMLSSFRMGGRNRARAFSGIGALALMAGLACYLSVTYSFLFASQLAAVGMLPVLLLLMSVMSVIVGVFFTIFAAHGVVFGGKDNDLMLSLPVSSFTLMLSRTLALYLENLVFSLFVMLPAGGAYLFYGGAGGVRFAVTLLICTVFLALIPTLIALLCGFVLAWFTSKFGRVPLLATLLYFFFFGLLMVGLFYLNRNLMNLAAVALSIQEGFTGWGYPFQLLTQAVCDGSLPSLLGFLAICLLPFLGAVWLFARRYRQIVTGLAAKGARSDYRLGTLAVRSPRRALLKKEAGRYFGTPTYIFNTGFGLILMLVAAVAALVMRASLSVLLPILGESIMPLLALGLAFFLSTVAVTASSISLEGKYLWILKEAPVSVGTLFAVKVGFQMLLCLPCLLVSVICLGVACAVPVGQWLLMVVVLGIYTLLSALLGLLINLCYPKLDAANDAIVVKQSASAILSTLGAMLLVAVGVGLYFLTWRTLGMNGAILLCGVLYALGSALLLWLLQTKGKRMFQEL